MVVIVLSPSARPTATVASHLRTLAAALTGGAVASLLHIPLAWMIGALIGAAALAWTGRATMPVAARPAGLVLLGLGLGQTFSGPVLVAVVAALPVMVATGVLSILVGLLISRMFVRLAGTDARTAFFASVPGGVIVMAVLAQAAGASVPAVTLAQTIRVLVVVLTFPPLLGIFAPHGTAGMFSATILPVAPAGLALLVAGGTAIAFLLRLTGMANPWMMGPCVLAITLSATGHLPSGVPMVLVNAAQVAMGATLGMRLSRDFLLGSRRLALASLASAVLLSVLLALLAVGVAWGAELPVVAVLLGMAPGGMPEMAVTAKALDFAVPLVLGFHLVRTMLCNLCVGPLWRRYAALRKAPGGE